MFKKFSNEIKIGIIVTSGLLMLIWGINYMKGIRFFSNQKKFYAVYNKIDGLVEANPVQINGMQVGQVREIKFLPDNSGKIIVTFYISGNLNVPKNSTAKIVSSDIMGSKAVELQLGEAKEYAEDGDTLFADLQLSITQEVNRQVAPIKAKAESLLASLDSVLSVIQGVFNPETRANLTKSFSNIEKALSALEHASFGMDTIVTAEKVRFREIMQNLESITRNIKNNNERISTAMKNMADISDTLAKAQLGETIRKTNAVMSQISGIVDKINHGEGSLGLLVTNDSLYDNLTAATKSLDELVKDLNQNPKRYVHFSVFGKKDKKKKTKNGK